MQHGAFVYVACFGVEGEPGRSGIAAVRVSNWTLAKERPVGVHVHSLYVHDMSSFYPSSVSADYAARFVVMDVGDPWETAPGGEALGGLYLLNTSLEGEATRLGAPLHARMAAFSPPPRVFAHPPPPSSLRHRSREEVLAELLRRVLCLTHGVWPRQEDEGSDLNMFPQTKARTTSPSTFGGFPKSPLPEAGMTHIFDTNLCLRFICCFSFLLYPRYL